MTDQVNTIRILMEDIKEYLYQSNHVYREIPGGFMVLAHEKTEDCVKIMVTTTSEKVNWEE